MKDKIIEQILELSKKISECIEDNSYKKEYYLEQMKILIDLFNSINDNDKY